MSTAPQPGHSATPLTRKLGITPEVRVAVLAAPAGFAQRLQDVPSPHTRLRGHYDVISSSTPRARSSSAGSSR
jgi:hypothetical protein